jgi:hypothetical protein
MNYVNIEIEQGLSYALSVAYTDEVTGLPKDVTNYTARLSVKPFADLPPAIDLTTENLRIVLGGVTGTVEAYFPPDATATATWVQAPYDLILADPTNVKVKLLKGLVTILPSESI